MRSTRRILAVLCIAALLAGALLAPVSGGSVPAVLVPLAMVFGLVVLPVVRASDPVPAYEFVGSGPRPSRAPPVA